MLLRRHFVDADHVNNATVERFRPILTIILPHTVYLVNLRGMLHWWLPDGETVNSLCAGWVMSMMVLKLFFVVVLTSL